MQLIQLKLKFYQIILSKGQTYDHISTHILTHIQTQTQETSTSSMLQRSKPFYYPALSLSFSISLQDSVTVSRHFSISKSSCWPIFLHSIPLPYLENFASLGSISHVQIKPATATLLNPVWFIAVFILIFGSDRCFAPRLLVSCKRGPPITFRTARMMQTCMFEVHSWHSI